MPTGQRLTRQLVCDIESLLIQAVNPLANRQNTKSPGYTRTGMTIYCQGFGPLNERRSAMNRAGH